MADKYLMRVGIDLDQAQLDKVTGVISDQLVEMGEISDEFIDNALETARKYNEELDKQRKIVSDIEERLKDSSLDDATLQLLQETKKKAEKKISDYTFGNEEEGLDPKAVVDAVADYAEALRSGSDAFSEASSNSVSGLLKFWTGLTAAYGVVQTFVDKVGDAIDNFSNYSNQLNPLGAFGSQSQRDLMSRYGMTGTQALGFKNVLDALGMSESDLGKMTSEQREVFNSLTDFWNETIGNLDPDALERYTETMSEYQEIQAKYHMGLQAVVLKLVSESPKFNELIGKVENLMDETLNFLGSPLVQAVFDGLIDFLTSVVSILEKAMKLANALSGGGFGGSTINNTSNTTNTNNTFNMYGSDFRSNDELARQISYSTKGGYNG